MKLSKQQSQIITWVFIAAILFFLGETLFDNLESIRAYEFSFNASMLVLSCLLFGLSYLLLSGASHQLLKKMGYQISARENFSYLLYAQFGAYVPGKIWLYVIRYKLLKKYNVSEGDYLSLFAIEAMQLITSAAVLGFALLSNFFVSQSWFMAILVVLITGTGIGLHPKVFYPITNWLYRLVKRPEIPTDKQISYGQLISLFGYMFGYWAVLGIASTVLVMSFTELPEHQFVVVTGIFVVSYWIGLIGFTPSGLGIREGALSGLLLSVVAAPIAVLISLVLRIWQIANQLLWAGVLYIISMWRHSTSKHLHEETT